MIQAAATWLEHNWPRAYHRLRPTWRTLMQRLGRPNYWESRRTLNYYREVIRLSQAYAPGGGSVLDVGANDTEVLADLDWFDKRVALDRNSMPARRGVESVTIDFLRYEPKENFDLVLCLQVLEHLDDPGPFARKLLTIGRTTIITVPYNWHAGTVKDHVQDPVDEAKLQQWMQTTPAETRIVRDGTKQRLLAVYQTRSMDSLTPKNICK